MKLHNYFRSSASFRVRIALELKGLPYDYVAVHIARGDHKGSAYAALAADQLVPLLEDGGQRLSQSMAIIEYLDETHPAPALLPGDAVGRAQVRALSQSIACEIHPLNNLRVLKYLVRELKVDEEARTAGTAIGCVTGWRASSGNSRNGRLGVTALATRRPWPIAAWYRRYSMASVLIAT